MKSAFKINEEETKVSEDTHVLIEMGHYGFSVLWFKKDPLSVEGVATYNFPDDITMDTLQNNVQTIIHDNKLSGAAAVHVFYNFKESVLIPAEFHTVDSGVQQLNMIYGQAPGTRVEHEAIRVVAGEGNQEELYNVYRVPVGITEVVDKITSLKPRHSTTVQLKSPGTNVLQCTIFHNAIKVFLYSSSQLLIVQQFTYKTPADVVYHLLNTCDKYNVSPAEVSLNLDGMVDSESSLYQEIYKYFLNVNLITVAADINLSSGIKEHPLHFISHLTELARCV